MYLVSAVLNWVFVKFILGNKTLPLYFLYKTNCFDWLFITCLAFVTPGLKQIYFKKMGRKAAHLFHLYVV